MGVAPELQQQLQLQDDLPATSPSSFWSNKSKEVSIEGMDLAYATLKIVAKKICSDDSNATPKKLCVCAPTNHAGSFKCRLHRSCAAQKSSLPEATTLSRSHESLKSKGQTRLSRFGRAAAAASVEYNGQRLDPNQDSTKHPQ